MKFEMRRSINEPAPQLLPSSMPCNELLQGAITGVINTCNSPLPCILFSSFSNGTQVPAELLLANFMSYCVLQPDSPPRWIANQLL
ncbi:unnamed protein product [Nesidiocoris tenuis]|uniref:Uncharacterized protein n=1 Tax=Nesidiocoris tenuis TaxID=355587 RepID=A0A6H5GHN1_9HEMI|nr:unnamed protein product [Nesidiocoris tenuis]